MAKSGERPKGAVRVTAPAAQVARREGVTLEVARLQSGVSYIRVFRGDVCLGELWRYDVGGRWRVLPLGLPRRYRCYCTTQPVAVSALVQAHAACPASEKETALVPLSTAEHIEDLIRHVTLVRNACVLLGRRMIARGEVEDGRLLIARGHVHDASKWLGIEWDYLHVGPDVDVGKLKLAMHQHQSTNDHHPEFHGGIHKMPPLALAEMVCDWYARSQERATDLRQWITEKAMPKFGFKHGDATHTSVMGFVAILLVDPFVKVEG